MASMNEIKQTLKLYFHSIQILVYRTHKGKPPYLYNVTIFATCGQCLTFTFHFVVIYTTSTMPHSQSTTHHCRFSWLYPFYHLHEIICPHLYSLYYKKFVRPLFVKADLLIKISIAWCFYVSYFIYNRVCSISWPFQYPYILYKFFLFWIKWTLSFFNSRSFLENQEWSP